MVLPKPLRYIWGDLSSEEIKKFSILAALFFLVIGVYQMLKTMKDPMFDLYVGVDWTPRAKMLSILFIAFAVICNSKLMDLVRIKSVFYVLCGFYSAFFLGLSYLFFHPAAMASIPRFAWVPGSIVGWVTYLVVESFGSLFPALLWGFVASFTTTESAKRGYAMIITCTQLGAALGPAAIMGYTSYIGKPLPLFFAIAALIIACIPFVVSLFTHLVPHAVQSQPAPKNATKAKTGFGEGLRLLLTKPYLMGIFCIVTLYEFIGTILDFQKIKLMQASYPSNLDGGNGYVWIKSIEGLATGSLALLFALFGTSFFMRKLGIRFSLLAFPTAIGCAIGCLIIGYAAGVPNYYLMWMFLAAMVMIKGLNYSLNGPTREVLYIPTPNDVKFKTKGWIDAFGARLMKGVGSGVADTLRSSQVLLFIIGSGLSLGIVAVWIFVAIATYKTFEKHQRDGSTVV